MTKEERELRREQREHMKRMEAAAKEAGRGPIDVPFLLLVLLLTGVGLIMLLSASFPSAYYESGDPLYYFKRQAAFATLGLAAMVVIGRINYARFRGVAKIALGISIALLVAVIIPGVGITSHGATRWLGIPGTTMRFQPSEIAKLGDLRRLKPHRGARDTEPARRAVARDTDAGNDDRDEQGDGNAQRDLGHAAEARVVDAPDDDHGGKAERGKGRLPLKVVQRVARLIIGRGEARREEHDEPHAGEQQHEQEKRHIDGSAARLLRSGLHALHVLALLAPQLALLLRHAGSPPPIVF